MRIVIADDHPIFRSGLAIIVGELCDDARIIEVGDAPAPMAELAPQPDLVIVDLFFPGFDYSRHLPELRRRLPLTPLVVVSMLNDSAEIDAIMAFGVNGFVSKAVSPTEVGPALNDVMQGDIVVRTSDDGSAHRPPTTTHGLDSLSPRQLEILRMLRRGLSNKEIARELDLSPYTVRTHVSALLRALGVATRSAASAVAASRGLPPK